MNVFPHWKSQLSLLGIYLGMFIFNGIFIRYSIFEHTKAEIPTFGVILGFIGCFIGFILVLKKSDLLLPHPRYIRIYHIFLLFLMLFLIVTKQYYDFELLFHQLHKIQLGIYSFYPLLYGILLGIVYYNLILPLMIISFIPGVFYRKKTKMINNDGRKISIQNIFFCLLLYFQFWIIRLNTGFFFDINVFLMFLGFQSMFILGTILFFWTPRPIHLIYLIFIAILLSLIEISFFYINWEHIYSNSNFSSIMSIVNFIINIVLFFLSEFISMKNWLYRPKNEVFADISSVPIKSSSSISEKSVKKCIFCHSNLDAEKISALTSLNFIYCPVCGNKIMKYEIYPINEEELLAEHRAVLQKLDEDPSPQSIPLN